MLMEKKISFHLDAKNNTDFEDYVTQYYQE